MLQAGNSRRWVVEQRESGCIHHEIWVQAEMCRQASNVVVVNCFCFVFCCYFLFVRSWQNKLAWLINHYTLSFEKYAASGKLKQVFTAWLSMWLWSSSLCLSHILYLCSTRCPFLGMIFYMLADVFTFCMWFLLESRLRELSEWGRVLLTQNVFSLN